MTRKTATAERQNTAQTRKLSQRPLPFVGLPLMVPVGWAVSAVLHLLVRDDPIGRSLTPAALVAATFVVSGLAFHIGAKRRRLVAWHVTVTVALTGAATALTVAIGVPKWWSITYAIGGLVLAGSWGLYRIDALRHNPNEAEAEPDPLTKKLGLEATAFRTPQHHYDAAGDLTRIEVPYRPGPGETHDVVQGAVAGLEVAADQVLKQSVPRGRSRAVPGEGAGEGTLVLVTKDVLAGRIPWPGPSAPGAPITEPLVDGLYEDQQPLKLYIAGGHDHAPNPSSSGWMGMTRTGKTLDGQTIALEIFTRRRVQMMWFDSVKGAQSIAPIRDGMDVVVASDDPQQFRRGMKALINAVRWRAEALGRAGHRAWTLQAAEQLRMPLLVAHFEEADVLCDIAPSDLVFLASKGLSTGIVTHISLQRADAVSMPTGLRFNIGNWSCFGCGDEYSAGFALSDATISAGAHPENWKQSKPGYLYREGIGIDEQRWPVVARSFFATDDEMRGHTEEWAPRMDPLDEGTVAALGGWYAEVKAEMAAADEAARHGKVTTVSSNNGRAAASTASDGDPDGAEKLLMAQEIAEELAEMRASGELPPPFDEQTAAIDPTAPVPPPDPGDELTWGDGKQSAPTPQAAAEAFDTALREIAGCVELRDPDDPRAVVFSVGVLVERYRFRSRPWFSERLTACADGELVVPPGLSLARVDGKPGHYRLRRDTPIPAHTG